MGKEEADDFLNMLRNVGSVPIKVKYYGTIPELSQEGWGSWIDCYTAEEMCLKAGARAYVPLGFAMELPPGYEAILAPRSSTFKRWGILQTNSIGVIDSTYNGDDDQWMMPVLATRDVTIPKETRLCQFRIQEEQPKINFIPVSSLGNEARGGLGSTGA